MKNAWFMDSCASSRNPDLCPYAVAPAFGRFSAREAPSNTGRAKNFFALTKLYDIWEQKANNSRVSGRFFGHGFT
jgi:hypothetical protein